MKCVIFSSSPPPVELERLYSVHFVGKLLSAPGYNITPRTVYRWIQYGVLVATTQPGRTTRVSGKAILDFWKMATQDIVFGYYPRWSKSEGFRDSRHYSSAAASI